MEYTKPKVIAVIGGDSRQAYLANMLALEGFTVIVTALEKMSGISDVCFQGDVGETIASADIIVLPMPLSKDGVTLTAPYSYSEIYLSDIWAVADKTKLILGGMVTPPQGKDLNIIDYSRREELSIMNAIPTAEAAIEIAIRETDITIYGSDCIVIGHGRIGKLLSARLKALGAKVTVTARRPSDLAWIKAEGHIPAVTKELHKIMSQADMIFNTVPSPVINRRELVKCKKEAIIIDLASAPGGTDFSAAEQCGIKAIPALSLPGKTAPVSAAGIVKDTIITIIREENI